jgi:hypothetical protein
MTKKMLIIFTVFVLIMMSGTPALAQKPVEPNGKGNPTHENQGSPNSVIKSSNRHNPTNHGTGDGSETTGTYVLEVKKNNTSHGFDDSGYNRSARIFNGTAMQWCMEKVGDPTWCGDYLGDTANDHLIMKWNAEWDRGNNEGWIDPPYDAWENNEWNGKVPGGSGDVWHYKIVWVGDCGADPSLVPTGGYCIWGQFAVLMDQGTSDGVHEWLAHALPNGYGSYP